MKNIIIISLAILLQSCQKDTPIDKPIAENIDTAILLFVEDSHGNNLLNSTLPNAIAVDAIRLAYQVNGQTTEAYDGRLDCPNYVCYQAEGGVERIAIFPNATDTEPYPITYIRWGNGDTDTLKCHFVRTSGKYNSSVICDEVWYNGVQMFPNHAITEFDRAFKIIK